MWAIFLAAGVAALAIASAARPGFIEQLPRQLVWVAAAGGAVALALSDAAPTGWEPFDLLLRAGLGALVPLAAARAGRASTIWLALVATGAGVIAEGWPASVAALSLGALLGATAADERSDVLRAAAAAAAVASLGHLDESVRLWLPSIATALGVVPVLLVGWARAPRRVSGWVWAATSVSMLVVLLGAGAGAYAAFQARTAVDDAVDAATEGLDLLGDDDEAAVTRLDEAAASFADAEDNLRAWWARPALLVPAVAQQSRAVATMAGAGKDLAETASEAVIEADVESVRPIEGVVDLAAMEAISGPLNDSVESLRRADGRLRSVDSAMLLPPVADRLDDLHERVGDALEQADTASRAVEVAPGLLGADGPRRYFLALQTPSEARGIGGFMGSWAELVIDQGRFDLVRTGRVAELTTEGPDPEGRRIQSEPEFAARYTQLPAQFWGLIGFSPDMPTVGSIITELFPQSGGAELDGVVAIDPSAFASFLELTGPIGVPGYPQQLSSENAAQTLQFDQYLTFPREDNETRTQFLADATQVLFDALTGGELPGPAAIAAELGPAVDGRHLQLFSIHEEEQRFFDHIGATGSIERDDGDVIGLVGQNFNGNKIDWFLRRSFTYDLTWDPATGAVSGFVEARIANEAPATGLPPSIISWGGDPGTGQAPVADGENFMELSLFSALPLGDVTVDGEPIRANEFSNLGMQETYAYVRVPSQSTVVVRAAVGGVVAVGDEYVLRMLRQPTVVPDEAEVRIRLAPGWTAAKVTGGELTEDGAAATWTADAPQELRLRVERRTEGATLLDRLRGE